MVRLKENTLFLILVVFVILSLSCTDDRTITPAQSSAVIYDQWQIFPVNINKKILCIAANDNLFIAGCFKGSIYTSSNLTDWTEQLTPVNVDINDLHWSGREFIAVCNGGRILTSTNGVNWEINTHDSGANFVKIKQFDSLLILIGSNGGKMLRSTDAVEWTLSQTGQPASSVAFNGYSYITVTNLSPVMVSKDGDNWSEYRRTMTAYDDFLTDIVWDGFQYIAVGNNGQILTTLSGADWTTRSYTDSLNLTAIAVDNSGTSIAVGHESILYSADGHEWNEINGIEAGIVFNDVYWTGKQFLVVGYNNTISRGEVWATPAR